VSQLWEWNRCTLRQLPRLCLIMSLFLPLIARLRGARGHPDSPRQVSQVTRFGGDASQPALVLPGADRSP
jgi:hypothetical protein